MRNFILTFLLLCSICYGDGLAVKDGKVIKVDEIINPVITFTKPDKAKPGMLIVKARLQNYASDNVSSVIYDWRVTENSQETAFLISKDDSVIALGITEDTKIIEIDLDVKLTYKLENDENFDLTVHGDTFIEGNEPKPPSPTPTPTPPNLREHAKFVYELVNSLRLQFPKLTDEQIRSSAASQVLSYTTGASKFASMSTNSKEVLNDIKKWNTAYLTSLNNPEITNFWDAFGEKQADYLWEWHQKSNRTAQEFYDMLKQIAEGLEAIK